MNTTEHELMTVVMQSAVELVQTYDSTLSAAAIRTRMERIADDLIRAAEWED